MQLSKCLAPALLASLVVSQGVAAPVQADGKPGRGRDSVYEVRVTNITKTQTFTPLLFATHRKDVTIFDVGSPASLELEILAEAGDTQPLSDALTGLGSAVKEVQTRPGLLGPGETAVVEVRGSRLHRNLSVIAMLIPTNDNFVALNVRLPSWTHRTASAPAYDAGTEFNDQACANIPGPRCGGGGHSPGPNEGDEGFVFIGNGFHDLGSEDAEGNEVLGPFRYDWRNPVAHVTVRRLSSH